MDSGDRQAPKTDRRTTARETPDGGTIGRARTQAIVSTAAVVCGAAGIAMQQLGTGEPDTTRQWLMLIVGSLIGGAGSILATGLFDQLLTWAASGWGTVRQWLRWRTVLMTAFASVLALLVGFTFPTAETAIRRSLYGCEHPVQLRMLTSPNQLAPMRELVRQYERQTAADNGACQTASVYVYAGPSNRVKEALVAGWSMEYQSAIGPKPDVWLADSTVEVAGVAARAGELGVDLRMLGGDQPVAYSPIVVAVNAIAASSSASTEPTAAGRQGATSTRLADRQGLPWDQVQNTLAAAGWGLIRPDPNTSVSGSLATSALYATTSAGTPVTAARARTIEQAIERTLDAGEYPIDDDTAMLCRYHELATANTAASRVAIVMPEQTMLRYNLGNPLSGECAISSDPPTSSLLMALYPAGTPSLNHPLVRFQWKDRSAAQTDAIKRFGRWLRDEHGQEALLGIGLRPIESSDIHEPLTQRNGVLPGAAFDRHAPDRARISATLRVYEAARRRGRVLLALDASGSMLAQTGQAQTGQAQTGQAQTRFQVAAAATKRAQGLMGQRDEFGLWVFHGAGDATGRQQLMPISTGTGPVNGLSRQQALDEALSRVVLGGETPLYATIAAAIDATGPSDTTRSSAVVVLTDGEDTTSAVSANQLVATIAGQGTRVFVIAVGQATCDSETLSAIASGTGGSCVKVGLETVDQAMSDVFRSLWGGQDSGG